MSKILFTVALNHDGRRPQFVISTNNLYAVQVSGKDFAHPKIGNANVGGGFKNRFEYAVTGGKGITRLSLVMNTSAVLPHMSWATKAAPPKTPPVKEAESQRDDSDDDDDDDRRGSRRSERRPDRYLERPDRRPDRYLEGPPDRHSHRRSDKHSDRHSERPSERHSQRHSERHSDRHSDRYSDRHSDRPSERRSRHSTSHRHGGDGRRPSRRYHHNDPRLDDGNVEADNGDDGGGDIGDVGGAD